MTTTAVTVIAPDAAPTVADPHMAARQTVVDGAHRARPTPSGRRGLALHPPAGASPAAPAPNGHDGGGRRSAPVGSAVDRTLEALVLPSMLGVGSRLRRRLEHFEPPARLDGRRVVITGATSGIGREAAVELAGLGARLTVLARSAAKAQSLREELAERVGPVDCEIELVDLSDTAAVIEVAGELARRHEEIDVLCHNAGALARRYRTGPGGIEETVATQVCSVVALTEALLGPLERARGRVLTMTSAGMYTVRHDLAALEATPDGYDGRLAYARAKRAQVVLTVGWARTLTEEQGRPVTFHAVHPGWVATGGLREGMPVLWTLTRPALRTLAEGADTLVWLAGAGEAAGTSGLLWHDRRPRPIDRLRSTRLTDEELSAAFEDLVEWCHARTAR